MAPGDDATAQWTGRQRAAWNAGGVLVARAILLAIGFFLVPFMIEKMGKEEYGLFQFTQTFLVYLPLLTLSAGTGLNRFLTNALARDEPGLVARTLATGAWVLSAAALALGGAGALLAWSLPEIWPSLGEGAGRARQLLFLLSAGLAIQTVAGVFRAVLFAHERLGEANLLSAVSNVVRAAVIVVAFQSFGGSLLWVGVATLLGILVESAVEALFARKLLPGVSISWRERDAAASRELLSFSALATFGGFTNALLLSSDNLLIQAVFGSAGPERIAVFSVAAMWDPMLRGFLMQLTAIVVPRMTQMAAREDLGALRDLTNLSVRYATALVAGPCIVFGLYADAFLGLWLGATLSPDDLATAARVLRWILVTIVLQMSMNSTYGVFYATGHLTAPIVVSLLVALAKIGLSLALAGPLGFGLPGIAMATAVCVGVSQILVRPWLLWREIALSPGCLLATGLAPGAAAGAVVLAAGSWLVGALPPTGIVGLAASAAGLGLAYALLCWLWVVLPEDRRRVQDALGRALRG